MCFCVDTAAHTEGSAPKPFCSHARVSSVCGFDVSAFQRLAEGSEGRHGAVFPYTVSEYTYTELSDVVDILRFDFEKTVESLVWRLVSNATAYALYCLVE